MLLQTNEQFLITLGQRCYYTAGLQYLAILGIKEVNNYTGKRNIQDYMSDYIYNFDRGAPHIHNLCTVGSGI